MADSRASSLLHSRSTQQIFNYIPYMTDRAKSGFVSSQTAVLRAKICDRSL
ncbi:MAG: hypothetical protein ACRC62_33855 [Microcoleus sp.]